MDLPEVSQSWDADVGPYVAAMAELIDATARARDAAIADMAAIQAAIDGIHGTDVRITVDDAGLAEAQAAIDALHGTTIRGEGAGELNPEDIEAFTRATEELGHASEELGQDSRNAGAGLSDLAAKGLDAFTKLAELTSVMTELGLSLKEAVSSLGDFTGAAEAAARAETDVGRAAEAAAQNLDDVGRATEASGQYYDDGSAAIQAYRDSLQRASVDAVHYSEAIGQEQRAALGAVGALKGLGDATKNAGHDSSAASDALHGVISDMQSAGQATRFFGLSMSALHWIVGVSAEALAVLLPAIVAFGAGLDVAMQGAVNAGAHMEALWTAAEATNTAFGQTLGTLLHLKPALQEAQDAANPGVYEILGSAVNDAKAHMSSLATAGLDVVHMWDEFSARITVDMQAMAKSGEMQSLLGNMVSDLTELGQVFGNVGHAILNFAADMPGLAEVLLSVVDGISRVILWLSTLPHWLIEGAMAAEEFYRWGGLLASVISRIGLVLPMIGPALLAAPVALFGRLAAIMGSVVGVGAQLVSGLASVAGGIAKVIPSAEGAAKGLDNMASGMAEAASDTAMMGTLGLLAVAIGGVGIALDHIRSPAQQFADSINRAVAAASNATVLTVLASGILDTSQKIAQQDAALGHYSPAMQAFATSNASATASLRNMEGPLAGAGQGAQNLNDKINMFLGHAVSLIPVIGGLGKAYENMTGAGGAATAAQQASELNAEQEKLIGTFRTVTGNIGYLSSAYHISGAAAVALATEAGVNLKDSLTGSSEAARIARQQIQNLITGLGAMSAPAGVVGNDMEALGIQSQLAGTKVQQLNQAWDAWISSVTGSMADFAQAETAIGTMANDSAAKSAALSGSIGSVSLAAGQVKYSLQGMSQSAMQSWQQFTSAVGTGEQALDQLRTGMAEGVVSAGQFGSTVRGLIGQLIPFAAGNKTAVEILSNLAHEADGPVTTSLQQLAEWTGVKGKAAADQFSQGMNKASQEMGNMSAVAQNLSAVVSSDLNTAMAQSILNVTRIGPLTQAYVTDLSRFGANATQTKGALAALNTAEQQAQKLTQQAGNAASQAAGQFAQATAAAREYAKALDRINGTKVETYVVTNFVSTGYAGPGGVGHRVGAHGGMVGASGIIPSFAQGGVLPGFAPGVDNMLALLSGGESILNPYATQALGGKPVIDWLNSTAWHGGGAGGGAAAGGAAGGGQMAENHVHVYLDGKEIYASVKQQSYTYQTRNAGQRTGLLKPGTRP